MEDKICSLKEGEGEGQETGGLRQQGTGQRFAGVTHEDLDWAGQWRSR